MREVVMQAAMLWKGDLVTVAGRAVRVDSVQKATKIVTGGTVDELIVSSAGVLYAFAPTDLVRVVLPDAPVVLAQGEQGGMGQPVVELEVDALPAPPVVP